MKNILHRNKRNLTANLKKTKTHQTEKTEKPNPLAVGPRLYPVTKSMNCLLCPLETKNNKSREDVKAHHLCRIFGIQV